MRRLWSALATLSALVLFALGSASAPAAVPMSQDAHLPGPQNWHLLIDQSGRLSLDEVLAQRSLFNRLERRAFSSAGGTRALWLQMSIAPHDTPRWLWLSAPRVGLIDFYLLHDGELERQVSTGEARPRDARPLDTLPYLFRLPGDGKPHELYLRLQSSQPLTTHFHLMDESGFLALERRGYGYGLLLGSLLLLALYNLARAIVRRSPCHAWLTLLHLALALCTAGHLGLLDAYLPDVAYAQARAADAASLLSGMLLLVFAHRFYRGRLLRHGRAISLVALLLLGLQVLALSSSSALWSSPLVYFSAFLAPGLVTLHAALHWRLGHQGSRLLAAGGLAMALGFAWFLSLLFGYSPLDPHCPACVILWSAPLAGLLFNLALVERQRQVQREAQEQRTAEAIHSAELRTRADFLAHISHELRAPLNGVLGMTELLSGTNLSERQRDYVQTIRGSGNELLKLINELLDLPKLQSGILELEEVQFDLPALISDSLDIFRGRAEQQGVELISCLHAGVPAHYCGDPARLRQVLINLLDNALRQTDGGEILVDVSLTEGTLRISVHDNGRALEASEYQALLASDGDPHPALPTEAGARPGLLIARQLVSLMQGSLGGAPGAEGGNTLWIDLPFAPTRPGEPHEEPPLDDGPLHGVRVLIVDDNDTCRKVLEQQCSQWGMRVSSAASGKEALAQMRTRALLNEYFDVVLLDHEMPYMTGLQLATRVREDLNLKHDVLLIMLTGISHAPTKVLARNAGIRRILTKPVAGYTLKATLTDELSRHRRLGAEDPRQGRSPMNPPSRLPQGLRILVAEDDSTSTKVMRGLLNKLDLHPDMVADGAAAVQAVKAQPYDLVLMDCEMPVLDGYNATRQIREWERQEQRPHTPVVALTAHVFSEHRERAREAGMDGHLSKPIELSELRELISHWSGSKP